MDRIFFILVPSLQRPHPPSPAEYPAWVVPWESVMDRPTLSDWMEAFHKGGVMDFGGYLDAPEIRQLLLWTADSDAPEDPVMVVLQGDAYLDEPIPLFVEYDVDDSTLWLNGRSDLFDSGLFARSDVPTEEEISIWKSHLEMFFSPKEVKFPMPESASASLRLANTLTDRAYCELLSRTPHSMTFMRKIGKVPFVTIPVPAEVGELLHKLAYDTVSDEIVRIVTEIMRAEQPEA